jgi:hypothetical protein
VLPRRVVAEARSKVAAIDALAAQSSSHLRVAATRVSELSVPDAEVRARWRRSRDRAGYHGLPPLASREVVVATIVATRRTTPGSWMSWPTRG